MHSRLSSLAVAAVMIGGIALAPAAKADEWNKRTVVTFSAPIEIPGRVLPAGTYVMKLADSPSDRDIVQFFNKTETHLIDTVLAIPDYRLEPTGHTVITFEERAADAPQAIKTWFYPGDLYGQEFVYHHRHPIAVAQNTTVVAPQPAPVAQAAPAPAPAPQPQQPTQMAEAAPAPAPPAAQPAPQPAPQPQKTLPKTGSDLPLIGLMGIVSMAAGLVLRKKGAAVN